MNTRVRHCVCSIVPPHMLRKLAESDDPQLRKKATDTLNLTAQLRGQRQFLGLVAPARLTPGALTRTVYNANSQQNLPGTLARSEGQAATGDTATDQAYDGAGATWDLYRTVFGRDSIDNAGMPIESSTHYGTGYDNAFWNGSQMVYGDGDGTVFHNFTGAVDVIGHELTHGVTQSASGLVYHGESGALNEHLSDVFGSLVKQYTNHQSAASADWLIGQGVLISPNARALRDMRNPGTAYRNVPGIGDDPQPDNYANLYTGTFDNGGVHINSGIPNKVFASYAVACGGNAWDTAGKVWYRVATGGSLPATATFSQFKQLTVQGATAIAPGSVAALTAAWNAVGVS